MNEHLNKLHNWLAERSSRERYFLFAIGFAVIYFLQDVIFESSVYHEKNKIHDAVAKVTAESQALQIQTDTILSVIKTTSYRQVLNRNKKLTVKSQTLNQRLANISPNIVAPDKIANVVEDILKAQEGMNLVSVKKLPPELWISKDWVVEDIPAYFREVYRYLLEIELQSDYFSTLHYLQRIEKLPWPIYWDKFDYKVIEYPKAKVIIRLYLLIHSKKVQ